jgi:uncharacterized protein YndB with AHSA1/START domain
MASRKKGPLPLGKGKLSFKVSNLYAAPAGKVWEAIAQARHTQKYFVTRVKGDFTSRLTPVEWYWKAYGRHALQPTVYREGKKLEFVWPNWNGKYQTTVTFTLHKKGRKTQVVIHERGWTQSDLKNAFGNCEGWTTYLAYLKAYLSRGIDLRTVKQ